MSEGKSLSLQDKVVGITGASGTLGQALIAQLSDRGAKVIAFTTNRSAVFPDKIEILPWQLGNESELLLHLQSIDLLIINHGINVYGNRTFAAINESYQVNTFSALRLAELFLSTVVTAEDRSTKELWINTSEAEVNPAFSPLYELSKRALGDAISLLRIDSPCPIRKLILGPFKSKLNPYGVMSPQWVAGAILFLANLNIRDIIVTINPITYSIFPIKEFFQSVYFRSFTKN
jgi:monoglucosyldiacylglycerol epimerase